MKKDTEVKLYMQARHQGRSQRLAAARAGRLTLDHVVPVSRGGTSELNNLVTACVTCNSAKGTRTPQEWLAALQQRAGRA